MKLTHTARTILRSRVRRHAGNGSVLNGRKVSDLSNADLLQAAMLLQLDVPTPEECTRYEIAKEKGDPVPLEAADRYASANGRGGAGMSDILASPTGATNAGTPDDDEKAGPNDEDELDLTPGQPTDGGKTEGADRTDDPDADRIKQAEKVAAEIRAKLGVGDFVGFNSALVELAAKALEPKVIQAAPVQIDPSKIEGHIPQITGRKTAAQMGLRFAIKVDDAATALDVYDAPDAPAVDPHYQWPDETGVILETLAGGENVFLWGPAGTGKTSLPQQIAAHWKRPFVRVSCHEQTEAGALVGMTAPDPQEGAKWRDAQLAKAIRKPGTVILVDEPSAARPGAMFLFQSLLDDRVMYIEETGERVPIAPGVLFVFADNTNGTGDMSGQYEGTRRMNRALLDRFAVTIPVTYMQPEKEIAALVAKSGCTKKQAAALVKFANLTRQKATDGTVSHGIGFRRLLSLAKRVSHGVDPSFAFTVCVLETAPFDDVEPLRQMWTADMNVDALA